MAKTAETAIKKLLEDNEGNNIPEITNNDYGKGHYEGYHDALVDVMNTLGIEHNEKYYND